MIICYTMPKKKFSDTCFKNVKTLICKYLCEKLGCNYSHQTCNKTSISIHTYLHKHRYTIYIDVVGANSLIFINEKIKIKIFKNLTAYS